MSKSKGGGVEGRPNIGVVLIGRQKPPAQPLMKVKAMHYPDATPEGRARIDAWCERASELATLAFQGGATLQQAAEIANAFLREEVSRADLATYDARRMEAESRRMASNIKRRWELESNAAVYADVIRAAKAQMAVGATRDEILDAQHRNKLVKHLERKHLARILLENNALPRARRKR